MATALERRVEALEEHSGGAQCPRCSGTTVVYVCGELESVSRRGQLLELEEAEAFVAEEQDGRCPVCGAERGPEIVVGWYRG